MAAPPDPAPARDPHVPVLLRPLIAAVSPVEGVWIDGTFGAGGYARGLIAAGAARVIGIDRDPLAHEMAAGWIGGVPGIELRLGTFSDMDELAGEAVDGVVLDLGVSSMQLDRAERGFSFQKDGPLDMRMSQDGESAADLVNTADESVLADILYLYGEERASRRIARAIVEARKAEAITTTLRLAEIVSKCLPRPKFGESHPATRSFQALRIAVNAEFDQLAEGLSAAERALKPGGRLAVVTFHSLEDRIVKRFLQQASGAEPAANRYAPATQKAEARFTLLSKKAIGPDAEEMGANPRARSAKLRVAERTAAPARPADPVSLGLPRLAQKGRR
ncbi:16S rRNA (cytosine(1402)-N(4))-methyltransferase RsmH [Neotabrizicola sp. VNH66]|uniref:16S rRNA (cytosine(1402)-N(4))-methyltransferase RsmH n=1 Tax=Neotabrizicola sp. VNH66 TaxID=3400918 RepID=UPI003C0759BD